MTTRATPLLLLVGMTVVLALCSAASSESTHARARPGSEADDVDPLWNAFVDTLTAQGMTAPLVRPRLDSKTHRGLVLTQAVKKGDKIASIPKKVKLTLETAAHSPIGKVITEVLEQGLSSKETLTLYVLYELHRTDGASAFASYFDLLPATFDVPLFFEPEEKAYFQGTVLSLVNLQQASVARVHGIVKQLCKMPIGAALDCASLTEDEVRWAFFVVHSRGIQDETGALYLQPLADLFRGSSDTNAGAGLVSSKAGRTVVTALRDLAAGEEVFLAVRDATAGTRYATEGEYDPSRPNFLALEFSPASYEDTGDVFTTTVSELLRLAECFAPGAPAPKLRIGENIPDAFLACLRLVQLTPREFADVAAYEEASGKHWPEGKRFSLENELAVVSMLTKSLTQGLASYSTTADADAALLATGTLSRRAADLVAIRASEKRLLKYALGALEEHWLAILRNAAAPKAVDE